MFDSKSVAACRGVLMTRVKETLTAVKCWNYFLKWKAENQIIFCANGLLTNDIVHYQTPTLFRWFVHVRDILKTSASSVGITGCETCAQNPCVHGGKCQEANSETGFICLCPKVFLIGSSWLDNEITENFKSSGHFSGFCNLFIFADIHSLYSRLNIMSSAKSPI